MRLLDLFCGGGGAGMGYARADRPAIGRHARRKGPGTATTFGHELAHFLRVTSDRRGTHSHPGRATRAVRGAISVAGHCAPIAKAREAMGIDWMRRAELTEAIPPAYTEFLGGLLWATLEA